MKTLNEVIDKFEKADTTWRNIKNNLNYEDFRDALFYLKEYYWIGENCADALAEKYPSENVPLTWDELCKMEDTPVWLEWSSDGQWVLIAYMVDNDIKFFRYGDDRCFTLIRDEYEPDKWQAFRKERE